jgi:hypothetical protein
MRLEGIKTAFLHAFSVVGRLFLQKDGDLIEKPYLERGFQ